MRECKRVGVSAEISMEGCYTCRVFSSRLSNEKIGIKSQLTDLGIDQSGGRHHTAAWCSGHRLFSLHRNGTQSALGILKLVGQQQVSTRQNDTQRMDYQRPNCSNGVRICVASFKCFLFLKIRKAHREM